MSTIAAISTAPGVGGIGIIRMSGEDCFNILEKIFIQKNPQNIARIKGYTIKYGNIINEKNQIIDEVLVSYFKAPRSYTAENMCEINSHGGTVIMKEIYRLRRLTHGTKDSESGTDQAGQRAGRSAGQALHGCVQCPHHHPQRPHHHR